MVALVEAKNNLLTASQPRLRRNVSYAITNFLLLCYRQCLSPTTRSLHRAENPGVLL